MAINLKNEYLSPIQGHLDIIVDQKEEEFNGVVEKWNNVLIHGDPEGLRSLARVLIELADLDQDTVTDLPIGAREHYHLRPKWDLALSADETIVGRLDAKGTGAFYKAYEPRMPKKKRKVSRI